MNHAVSSPTYSLIWELKKRIVFSERKFSSCFALLGILLDTMYKSGDEERGGCSQVVDLLIALSYCVTSYSIIYLIYSSIIGDDAHE